MVCNGQRKDMNIEQLIPPGFCLECGFCCRFAEADSVWTPHLSDDDIRALDEDGLFGDLIDRTRKAMVTRPSRSGGHYVCACLSEEDHKCGIYAIRPMECGLYPLLMNRRHGRAFLAIDVHCKYVKENKGTGEFKEKLEKTIRSIPLGELRDLIEKDPSFAQEYEGAENILEMTG
jgi:Fe-S-cluster containining protein